MTKNNEEPLKSMDTNAYKMYINNSSFDLITKKLLNEMLLYPEESSEKFHNFFKSPENNVFHWGNGRTDKEHSISCLIGKSLYGDQEIDFYLDFVGIVVDGKYTAGKMEIQTLYKKFKTPVGMVLWLIEFFQTKTNIDINIDIKKLYSSKFLTTEFNKKTQKDDIVLTKDVLGILNQGITDINKGIADINKGLKKILSTN